MESLTSVSLLLWYSMLDFVLGEVLKDDRAHLILCLDSNKASGLQEQH